MKSNKIHVIKFFFYNFLGKRNFGDSQPQHSCTFLHSYEINAFSSLESYHDRED